MNKHHIIKIIEDVGYEGDNIQELVDKCFTDLLQEEKY